MNLASENWQFLPTILIMVSSFLLISLRGWRWIFLTLGLQLAAVFSLILMNLGIQTALILLVSGFASLLIVSMIRFSPARFPTAANQQIDRSTSQHSKDEGNSAVHEETPASGFIRLPLIILTLGLAVSTAVKIDQAITGLNLPVLIAALILSIAGITQIIYSTGDIRIYSGLTTYYCGFILLLSAVAPSGYILGVLSASLLGFGLITAYLITHSGLEIR